MFPSEALTMRFIQKKSPLRISIRKHILPLSASLVITINNNNTNNNKIEGNADLGI